MSMGFSFPRRYNSVADLHRKRCSDLQSACKLSVPCPREDLQLTTKMWAVSTIKKQWLLITIGSICAGALVTMYGHSPHIKQMVQPLRFSTVRVGLIEDIDIVATT